MKEGQNLSYVTKMGAYGFAVVAAFAVALAVLLSVSSTAEAEIQSKVGTVFTEIPEVNSAAPANNGDTVYVENEGMGFVLFEISTTGSASASFTHADASEDGQSITCGQASAAGSCDVNFGEVGVTVALKIDDDSGKGVVFVKQTQLTGTNPTTTTDAVRVNVAQVPTSLSVKAATSSIDAKGGGAEPIASGTTYVDIRLTDENGQGIAGEDLTIVSTRALLTTAGSPLNERMVSGATVTLGEFDGASLAGTVTTSSDTAADDDVDARGYARVVVTGGGSPGISTITVTVGDVTGTTDIVLHGVVKSISAELEQGAIEVGGGTRIVVTALDAGENPVANQRVSVEDNKATAPEKLAIPVSVSNEVNKDGGTVGSLADKGDIPACGTVPEAPAGTDSDNNPTAAVAGSTGTNAKGQCVIDVSAPGGTTATTTDDAARGTHTIVVVASNDGTDGPRGVNTVTLEVQVGGAPATVESDAPERLDPSGELTVNITVLDDEGVRVGSVAIEVDQTAGDGKIITEIAAKTSDGRAKFTYLAPSTPGVAEFLVRTRGSDGKVTSQLPVIVQIADEAMEDVPVDPVTPVVPVTPVDPVTPVMEDATLTGSGSIRFFSGGSVDDLSAAAAAACPGGAIVWVQADDGTWPAPLSTTAPAFANAPFTAAFPDGFDGPTGVWVSSCDEGDMDNEGDMDEGDAG